MGPASGQDLLSRMSHHVDYLSALLEKSATGQGAVAEQGKLGDDPLSAERDLLSRMSHHVDYLSALLEKPSRQEQGEQPVPQRDDAVEGDNERNKPPRGEQPVPQRADAVEGNDERNKPLRGEQPVPQRADTVEGDDE